jgi:hypothetical protein
MSEVRPGRKGEMNMNKNGGKLGSRFGVRVAVVASLLGAVGCGSGDFEPESIGQTAEAVTISNWAGLEAMGTSGSYTLTADIDAAGKTWTPKSFSGTFDGGGKRISNLTINVAGDAGFFTYLSNSTVKNVKFINLRVTGTWIVGGLAAFAEDCALERVVVEGTITSNNGWAVGGITGYMSGGTLWRSYAKGTVNGSPYYAAGGLAGGLWVSGVGRGEIYESYAQVTVAPSTSDPNRLVTSGGIVGRTFAGHIHDVYAVGNVTGRGAVGGLVGYLDGDDSNGWMLYKGIYRGGDVVDRNKSGGWEGTIGGLADYTARFTMNHFDAQVDPSTVSYVTPHQEGHTTQEMKQPTAPAGGVFCAEDVVPGRCGDNTFFDPPWNPGNSSQHHTLRSMPGPNPQPL